MDFNLSEEEQYVRDVARKFSDERLFPRAGEFDKNAELDRDVIREMAELGLMGVKVPEAYGGTGLSNLAYTISIEELARGCASHALVAAVHGSLFAMPLLEFGTEDQKKKYLPPVCAGEKMAAYSLSEAGSGSDAASLSLLATEDGDDYVLNGTKLWVTQGSIADYIIVFATIGKEHRTKGIVAFVIETDRPGFSVGKNEVKMGFKASPTSELVFDEYRVPKANRIGEVGRGFNIAMETLNHGRISVGAQSVGMAQRALEIATVYAQQRVQFGQELAKFQAIQFKLADMQAKLHAARLVTYEAAWRKDQGLSVIKDAAIAKMYASEVGTEIAHQAMQILGGYGYTHEYNVERIYRDVRLCEIFEGTNEVQRIVIARELLKELAVEK
ncbi:MAG: acyl-CoA dehydrogenase family protein [candidate division Zixibacteria bacterium]|jgi:acyl-CoA dehydrogenase|nr:acyl-CoA dehydrogenase family protein [candidate division Zixibacteria bacterium]